MSSTTSTEEEDVLPDSTVSESGRSESEDIVSTQEEEREEKEDAEEKKDPPRDEVYECSKLQADGPHAESEEIARWPAQCPVHRTQSLTHQFIHSHNHSLVHSFAHSFTPSPKAPHAESEEMNSLASTVSSSQDSQDSSDGTIHALLPKVNCPEKIVVCLDMGKEMTSRHVSSRDGSQFSPLSLAKRVIEIFVKTKSRMDRRHQFALMVLHDTPTLMLSELLLSPHLFLDALYVHEPPAEDNKSIEIFNAICDLDRKCLSYVYEVATNVTMFHNHMAKLLAHPLQRPTQSDTYYKLQSSEDVS
uniref:BRISC and BRCA1-A complex member 1 n=1 Tax=Branchiostoma floridae TaxID=7739 RepID=C3YT07_BRAFL|eukprot:XP_002600563.1 hypothetical protein BRAFLDRAFT_119275 [Branchiostoma floridae]